MLVVDDRMVTTSTHDLMISSHNNNGETSGQIIPFWSNEEAMNRGTKQGIQPSSTDSQHKDGNSTLGNSALSTVNLPKSSLPMSNVVYSDDPPTTPLLTESEMYQTVFHGQFRDSQDEQISVTPLQDSSPAKQQPAKPLPSSTIIDSDMVATLEESLPYVPPHSDYAIVEDSYKAAYHVVPNKKRKRRETSQQKMNYKELATVGKPKNPKKALNAMPGNKVIALAQWTFPKGLESKQGRTKAAWIRSKVRQGKDVAFVPIMNAKSQITARPRQSRKRNLAILEDEQGDHLRISIVYDVWFDKQLLQYDNSPYGFLDQFVRPSVFLMDTSMEQSYVTRAPHLQMIPDPPIRMTKASRIGASYQARVCRRREDYHDKRNAKYLPMYDAIWDPVLADAAEKEGQDIEGFLGRSMKLAEREMRMKLLHSCGYQVNLATEEYRRLQMFGWEEDISWTRAESLELERQLRSPVMKDFTTIARKMQRSRSECLVQYYRWKSTASVYHELKKTWRENNHHQGTKDYCVVCGDGGDLLVCDRCDDPYHLGCLKPSLDSIPVGDWFCPRCVPPRNSFAVVARTTGGSSPLSKWWSQTARVTNGVVVKEDQKATSLDVKATSSLIAKESPVVLGPAVAGGSLPHTRSTFSAVSISSSPGLDLARVEACDPNDHIDSDMSIVSEPADV